MSCISNNSDISARLHELEDRIIKLETIISDLIETDKIKNISKKPQKRGPKMPELVNVDKLTRNKDKLTVFLLLVTSSQECFKLCSIFIN